MARKYQLHGLARLAAMANFPLAALPFNRRQINASSSIKKIHSPRRPLPVLFVSENPQTIKIRHTSPELDSLVKKISAPTRPRV